MVIPPLPVNALDVLPDIPGLIIAQSADSLFPVFHIRVQEYSYQTFRALQHIVGTAPHDNTALLRRQLSYNLGLEPEQIVRRHQVGAKGRTSLFRGQALDNLI